MSEKRVVLVLGDQNIPWLQRGLFGVAKVEHAERWVDQTPDVLIIAPTESSRIGEMLTLARARAARQRLTIVVFFDEPLNLSARQELLMLGADDIVTRPELIPTCLRRLPAGAEKNRSSSLVVHQKVRTRGPAGNSAPPSTDDRSAPSLKPSSPDKSVLTPHQPHLQTPQPSAPTTFIPQVSVSFSDPTGMAATYVSKLLEYQASRANLMERVGPEGMKELQRAIFLRDKTIEAAMGTGLPDLFGLRSSDVKAPITWPVEFVAPSFPPGGFIQSCSADGLSIVTNALPPRAKRLTIRLEVTAVLRAEMTMDLRWTRRTGKTTWQIGASYADLRVEYLNPET